MTASRRRCRTYRFVVAPNTDISGAVTVTVKDNSDLQATTQADGSNHTFALAMSRGTQLQVTATKARR